MRSFAFRHVTWSTSIFFGSNLLVSTAPVHQNNSCHPPFTNELFTCRGFTFAGCFFRWSHHIPYTLHIVAWENPSALTVYEILAPAIPAPMTPPHGQLLRLLDFPILKGRHNENFPHKTCLLDFMLYCRTMGLVYIKLQLWKGWGL